MDSNENLSNLSTNQSEEENPDTFIKLKSILDENQINYTLLEVIIFTIKRIKIIKFFF